MRTTSPIAGLFGRSPFKPLQEQMKVVEECVAETPALFAALTEGDREALIAAKERIDALENRADEIKNEIRQHLPKSLFMPVDRRDLLDLLDAQDSIADMAQDVAGLLTLRPMAIPPVFGDRLDALLATVLATVRQCGRVIAEFDELLETGFRGREVTRVEEMVDELGRLETTADDIEAELTRRLFAHEDEMKPLAVVFWYELLRKIGDVADYAEDVGDRLRLLIAQ